MLITLSTLGLPVDGSSSKYHQLAQGTDDAARKVRTVDDGCLRTLSMLSEPFPPGRLCTNQCRLTCARRRKRSLLSLWLHWFKRWRTHGPASLCASRAISLTRWVDKVASNRCALLSDTAALRVGGVEPHLRPVGGQQGRFRGGTVAGMTSPQPPPSRMALSTLWIILLPSRSHKKTRA